MRSRTFGYFAVAAVFFITPFTPGSNPDRNTSSALTQRGGLRHIVEKLATIDLRREASFWNTGGPGLAVVHTAVTREVVSNGPSVIPLLIKRLDSSGYDESVYIVFCLRELCSVAAKDKVAELLKSFREKKRFPAGGTTLYIEAEAFLRDAETWQGR